MTLINPFRPLLRSFVTVSPWFRLTLTGGLFAAIFHWGFASRYPLAELRGLPHSTMSSLSQLSAGSFALYALGFAIMFAAYGLMIRVVRLISPRSRWALLGLVSGALVFNAILLPMYPYDADDVFDYIIRGRMVSVYGLNPLKDTPRQIPADPFYEYVGWKSIAGAYGAGWEWIAAATTRLAGDDFFANIIAFKLVAVGCHLATGVLIWLTLRRIAPRRAILGAYLWLWNPYIIFMAGMGAHNDAAMVALLLLALFCFSRRWLIAATVAALAGALVKFIPLALIPIIGLIALRELRDWSLVRYLVGAVLASSVLFIGLNAPFWTGDPSSLLSLDRRSQLFSGSVGAVLRQSLAPILDNQPATSPPSSTPVANAVVSRSAFGLLALFATWQLWRVWRDRDPLRPYRALAAIVMFYMLVSSFWFMPWYSVWLVPLIALLDDSPLRRLGLLFSYLVTWEMIIYQYITLRPTGFAPLPWRDLLPVAAYMGVAYLWIAAYWGRIWWRTQQFRSQPNPQQLAVTASIQAVREARGLTHSQLADEVDWPIDDLIAYERGYLAPSAAQLQQLQQLRESQ